jgi:hypothetical protein
MYSLNITVETLISFAGSARPDPFLEGLLADAVLFPRGMRVTN